MKDERREHLAKVFFDVGKYTLTVGVIAVTLKPEEVHLRGILLGLLETVVFLLAGWFTMPKGV